MPPSAAKCAGSCSSTCLPRGSSFLCPASFDHLPDRKLVLETYLGAGFWGTQPVTQEHRDVSLSSSLGFPGGTGAQTRADSSRFTFLRHPGPQTWANQSQGATCFCGM